MANLSENQTSSVPINAPTETSNSETTMQTLQAFIEQTRVTDEQEVVPVDANVDDTPPEATRGFNEEIAEGITQNNEVQSTRDNHMEVSASKPQSW